MIVSTENQLLNNTSNSRENADDKIRKMLRIQQNAAEK
jgi:hypothetical protein